MATVQNAQIRQHFIRMGMPKKEIDSIMRDNVIMQKTHIFINKWGAIKYSCRSSCSSHLYNEKIKRRH